MVGLQMVLLSVQGFTPIAPNIFERQAQLAGKGQGRLPQCPSSVQGKAIMVHFLDAGLGQVPSALSASFYPSVKWY